jgi:hypothetical protein
MQLSGAHSGSNRFQLLHIRPKQVSALHSDYAYPPLLCCNWIRAMATTEKDMVESPFTQAAAPRYLLSMR